MDVVSASLSASPMSPAHLSSTPSSTSAPNAFSPESRQSEHAERSEQRADKLAAHAAAARLRRAYLSEEERQQKREESAARARLRRTTMSEEEKFLMRQKQAERARLRRQYETEAERQERREKSAARARAKRALLTPEQRQDLSAKRAFKRLQIERPNLDSSEQIQELETKLREKRQKAAERARERRANLSEEERRKEREIHAARARLRRAQETPEQRLKRKIKEMEKRGTTRGGLGLTFDGLVQDGSTKAHTRSAMTDASHLSSPYLSSSTHNLTDEDESDYCSSKSSKQALHAAHSDLELQRVTPRSTASAHGLSQKAIEELYSDVVVQSAQTLKLNHPRSTAISNNVRNLGQAKLYGTKIKTESIDAISVGISEDSVEHCANGSHPALSNSVVAAGQHPAVVWSPFLCDPAMAASYLEAQHYGIALNAMLNKTIGSNAMNFMSSPHHATDLEDKLKEKRRKAAERARQRRANLTETERMRERAIHAARARERRAAETEAQKQERRIKGSIKQRVLRRDQMSTTSFDQNSSHTDSDCGLRDHLHCHSESRLLAVTSSGHSLSNAASYLPSKTTEDATTLKPASVSHTVVDEPLSSSRRRPRKKPPKKLVTSGESLQADQLPLYGDSESVVNSKEDLDIWNFREHEDLHESAS